MMHPAPLWLSLSGERVDDGLLGRIAGIGLVRGEYVLRRAGHYVTRSAGREFLARYLDELAARVYPLPVWYRTSDFESREISTLTGADATVDDENPLLGARGVRRGLAYPQAFDHELRTVAEVARTRPNLHLQFSFLGTMAELDEAIGRARRAGFENLLGTMVETPAAAVAMAEICGRVSHVTIGLNDLTSLFFGTDRKRALELRRESVFVDFVRKAVDTAASRDAEVVVGGDFLSAEQLGSWTPLKLAGTTVHYHQLPAVGLAEPDSLADLDVVPSLKRAMSEALSRAAEGVLSNLDLHRTPLRSHRALKTMSSLGNARSASDAHFSHTVRLRRGMRRWPTLAASLRSRSSPSSSSAATRPTSSACCARLRVTHACDRAGSR